MVSLYVGITDYEWFRFLSALPAVIRHTAIEGYAPAHFDQRRRTVARAECLPSQRGRQNVRPCEDPSADNEIPRRMQLEQEKLAHLERPKIGAPAGLPKIHFIDVFQHR